MRDVACCPVCACEARSPVCEFNGLLLLEKFRDSEMARYEYALCDRCGLVYPTRRPTDEEFQYLFENFDENLGRRERSRSGHRSDRRPTARRCFGSFAPR